MDELDLIAQAAGLDPEDADYRLHTALAEADDEMLEQLVALRKKMGLTQQAVADRMKRDKAAVSNFERLSVDPHLSTIRRYAAAIGASITHEVKEFDPIAAASYEPDFAAGPTANSVDDSAQRLEVYRIEHKPFHQTSPRLNLKWSRLMGRIEYKANAAGQLEQVVIDEESWLETTAAMCPNG